MKRIEVLTLFPALLDPFLEQGLLGRAVRDGLVQVTLVDLRPFGVGRHRAVDGEPYGGGAGMVLRPEPVFAAARRREAHHAASGRALRKILLTPQGRPFDQHKARELERRAEPLLLICGRYEGFDERIRQGLADEELSLGDFVCLGGEVAALAVIEAIARLVPGVLGNPASNMEESFSADVLEYPQYTRPKEFEGMPVPEVLLSGHHAAVAQWRAEQAQTRTALRRPDLAKRKTG
ncbi:MAG: tRNA (guanosine(37)-N1)-methyltransferase TrmD [bacterium]